MKQNIKIRTALALAISIILLSVSCSRKESKEIVQQKDNNTMLDIIERYYKMQNTKTEGSFMFQSNLTNNDPKQTKTVLMGGFFNDTKGKFETDGGDVSIAGKLLTNKNGWYGYDKVESQAGMYGTNVTFTLNTPISQGGSGASSQSQAAAGYNQKQTQSASSAPSAATTLSTTLYSPKPITITNIAPRTTINLVQNASTTITWNADPLDSNGVVIIASYLPTRIFNVFPHSQGYTTVLTSSELVPDNGGTTLPWSFFSQFPQGSHITLWVARGNYTILANKDYSYKVGGYTAAAVWDITIPFQPVTVSATNVTGLSGFVAAFTNIATNKTASFSVPSGGGTVGSLPPGIYNIKISKTGNATQYYFDVCGSTSVIATSASFTNATVFGACNYITIAPKNQIP